MAHQKIKKFIQRLNKRMFPSYQAYFIWKLLFLSRDKNTHGQATAKKHIAVINKYQNFFIQTERSNLIFFILGIAKFFDNPKNSNKPLSIKKVQNCAQGDRKHLTVKEFLEQNENRPLVEHLAEVYEGITEANLKKIDNLTDKNENLIAAFKELRDKWIAHEDTDEIEIKIPAFEKIEALFADIEEMINTLSYGLEHSSTSYLHLEDMAKQDVKELLKQLI